MSDQDLEALKQAVTWFASTAFTSRAANAAATTFLIWDHLICLEQEIALIWSRRWTFINIVYVLLRYGSLVGCTFCAMGYISSNVSDTFCRVWIEYQGYAGPLPWALVECVMIARVYALYERSKLVLSLLCIGFALQLVAIMVIWSLHQPYALSFTATPVPGVDFHICVPTKVADWLWVWWLPPILFDTTICVLVLWRGIVTYRKTGTGLIELILRDSILYYMGSVLVQFISMIMWRVGEGIRLTQMQSGTIFAAALVVVLCCRMVLNLRDYLPSRRQQAASMTMTAATDAWAPTPTPQWELSKVQRSGIAIHVKSELESYHIEERATLDISPGHDRPNEPTYSRLGGPWAV